MQSSYYLCLLLIICWVNGFSFSFSLFNFFSLLKSSYLPRKYFHLPAIRIDDDYVVLHSPIPPSSFSITRDFVDKLIQNFDKDVILLKSDVYIILNAFEALMTGTPALQYIPMPMNGSITVCGDIHGQYCDLCNIFDLFGGLPSTSNVYLFNGDFVDRGEKSLECMLLLMALKILNYKSIFLNRGNHEDMYCTSRYGFLQEIMRKYDDYELFRRFNAVFDTLPLASVIEDRILVVHGGISSPTTTLEDIRTIDKTANLSTVPLTALALELLWSDPQAEPGLRDNPRGVGKRFGPDVTAAFLQLNHLDLLIRSHQPRFDGYSVEHDGKCVTVFSAPNTVFRGSAGRQVGNLGAVVRVTGQPLTWSCESFAGVSCILDVPTEPGDGLSDEELCAMAEAVGLL